MYFGLSSKKRKNPLGVVQNRTLLFFSFEKVAQKEGLLFALNLDIMNASIVLQ